MALLSTYGNVARQALRRGAKAWPVAFSVFLYAAILIGAGVLVAPLGMIGGFILGLVVAACASSYLHLLRQAVNGSRLAWSDLRSGFGALFWDVISVMFALWVLSLAVQVMVNAAGPRGSFVAAAVSITMAVFFNPVPELVYLGSSRSFRLLVESYRFVMRHPFAWLLPNILIAALLLAPSGALAFDHPGEAVLLFTSFFRGGGFVRIFTGAPTWLLPALLLVGHWFMVFRGLLFLELESGSDRQRAFRKAMGG